MIDTALHEEAISLTRDLVRVDSSNPPGNETPAALVLKRYLEANGLECELVARDPDRANLVARIPGNGTGPSLALLGHTDVVPADAQDWQHRPLLRRRRRRRVPVGPWHRGHEERDGDARRGDGGAGARGLPAERRSRLHRRGRRGGRNPPGGDGLAGGRTSRPGHRLRHQRGRRRSHGAVGRARVRADLRRREVLPGRAGHRAGRGRPRLDPERRSERRAAAGDADRAAGRLPAGASAAAGDAGDAGGADRPVRRARPGRGAGAGGRRCTAAFPR